MYMYKYMTFATLHNQHIAHPLHIHTCTCTCMWLQSPYCAISTVITQSASSTSHMHILCTCIYMYVYTACVHVCTYMYVHTHQSHHKYMHTNCQSVWSPQVHVHQWCGEWSAVPVLMPRLVELPPVVTSQLCKPTTADGDCCPDSCTASLGCPLPVLCICGGPGIGSTCTISVHCTQTATHRMYSTSWLPSPVSWTGSAPPPVASWAPPRPPAFPWLCLHFLCRQASTAVYGHGHKTDSGQWQDC